MEFSLPFSVKLHFSLEFFFFNVKTYKSFTDVGAAVAHTMVCRIFIVSYYFLYKPQNILIILQWHVLFWSICYLYISETDQNVCGVRAERTKCGFSELLTLIYLPPPPVLCNYC